MNLIIPSRKLILGAFIIAYFALNSAQEMDAESESEEMPNEERKPEMKPEMSPDPSPEPSDCSVCSVGGSKDMMPPKGKGNTGMMGLKKMCPQLPLDLLRGIQTCCHTMELELLSNAMRMTKMSLEKCDKCFEQYRRMYCHLASHLAIEAWSRPRNDWMMSSPFESMMF